MAGQSTILVVGAGLAGSTAARILAESGHLVRVIDQRSHVAGNAYDYVNDQGLRIHQYGPHIFHTSDTKVWTWLSRFTEWIPYQHRVKCLDPQGNLVEFPPTPDLLRKLGDEVAIDTFYRPYSRKMWAVDVNEIDPSVLDRVRRRDPGQIGYFRDTYQALPQCGYTHMINRMLDHPNITVDLAQPWQSQMQHEYDAIFNSMSIDQFHDYCFGVLPYRSIRFRSWCVYGAPLSDVPVVNFTTQTQYTRVTDWRLFPNQPSTVDLNIGTVTLEYPCDADHNHDQRYYPVPDPAGLNRTLYQRYAEITPRHVIFIGRCGLYSYLDMHQAVSSTQHRVQRWLHRQ